jgi:hypothetical protein
MSPRPERHRGVNTAVPFGSGGHEPSCGEAMICRFRAEHAARRACYFPEGSGNVREYEVRGEEARLDARARDPPDFCLNSIVRVCDVATLASRWMPGLFPEKAAE